MRGPQLQKLALHAPTFRRSYSADEDRVKSGLEGEHAESNHRLMYTWAWPSPQKWRAPVASAASAFHLRTVSFEFPH
jgi:hypothetical protein